MPSGKLQKLLQKQQNDLDAKCKEVHDFVLHSGKDLTREEVEPYIEWIYTKIGLKKPIILILDSYLAQKLAMNVSNIGNQVRRQVESQVWGQVLDQVGSQVESQVGNQVWSQVWGQVGNQVDNKIERQVESQVWSQVRRQVESQELNFIEHYKGYGFESWWLTFMEYWKGQGIVKSKDFDKYLGLNKCGVWSICYFENAVFICKLPIKVLKDEKGNLHSVSHAAVQWRDGLNNYFIHGVGFDKEMWSEVVERKLSPKQLLSIRNTDQRFVAIQHYGFENIIDNLEKTLIDESEYGNKLYSTQFDDNELRFLVYPDIDDHSKQRISFVDPSLNSARDAMAWKHNCTEEEYQKMEVLKSWS